jgi:glycosyltransferase involved in cell wall biosynthesis
VRPASSRAKARNILFVGSPTTVNVNAVSYFTDEVLPIIRSKSPGAKFVVAGKICQNVPDRSDYVKLGEMPDLTPAYDIADVVVNPRRFGSGLSIKSIEALSYGKPLVATPSGCSGMEDGADTAFVLAHTPEQLAAGVLRLLDEPDTYRAFTHAGREYALRYNSSVAAALRTVLAKPPESSRR